MHLQDEFQQSLSFEQDDPLAARLAHLSDGVDQELARRVAEAAVAASRTPGASEDSVSAAVVAAVGDALARAEELIAQAEAELSGGG